MVESIFDTHATYEVSNSLKQEKFTLESEEAERWRQYFQLM